MAGVQGVQGVQPPSPPSPRTSAARPPRPASPGSSIEEGDDLYVSPKASPWTSTDTHPHPHSHPDTTTMATEEHAVPSQELSDYSTWSAAMAETPLDPSTATARKASDTSNGSSKRSLPQPPGPPGTSAEGGAMAPRKNSLQPTLSERYQQLKERSAAATARRASQSSDGHTFTTSWERRGSERSDDFHSAVGGAAGGFGRLPALEDVQQQQQQRGLVASPEPAHPQLQPSAIIESQGTGPHMPPTTASAEQSHNLHDFPAPPSSFPGFERQNLPPFPLSSGVSEVSGPQSSPSRRDSLPPIPSEMQSPQRRPSQPLPPIPQQGTGPRTPTSPTQRRPSIPHANGGENSNGGLRDFMPYASVYGGVDGEESFSSNRRNTLPPLPSPPREQHTGQSQAQLYAQQQMAQQRQQAEERRRQDEARQQQQPPQQPQQQPPQPQHQQPPQQQRPPPQGPLRSGYDSDKDQPPLPSPHNPPSGPPTPAPPSAFTAPAPGPPLPPGQSHSLPVRRSTLGPLGHASESYASQHAQQPPGLSHSHTTLRSQRTYAPAIDRSPATMTPQPQTPQRMRPLHPEFTHGDLTIQVSTPQPTDFLVSYTVLTTASGLIASTLAQFPANKAPRVAISESVPEARLLLSALNHGNINHSSLAVADRDPLGVAEYLTLLRLYRKYQVTPFFTDLLQYNINQRAVELSQHVMKRDRAITLDVVRLAVESRSSRLWDMLNKYSAYWFDMLAPARLSAEEKDRLGKTGIEILVAWNALRLGCGDRPDGVKVGYEGGRVCMWRVRDEKRRFYPCAA